MTIHELVWEIDKRIRDGQLDAGSDVMIECYDDQGNHMRDYLREEHLQIEKTFNIPTLVLDGCV